MPLYRYEVRRPAPKTHSYSPGTGFEEPALNLVSSGCLRHGSFWFGCGSTKADANSGHGCVGNYRSAKESSGELSFSSGSCRAPSPMEKALPRREHNFVHEQTNDDDNEHDADNLVHGIQ